METQQKKNIKKITNKGEKMPKIRYIAYINDTYIYLLDNKKEKIYEKEFKNLKEDQILDEQKFYFELNQFLFSNKIRIPIFGYKLKIIINDNLNNLQKNKFKEIFEDYFQKVDFMNMTEILLMEKNKMIINITETYLDFYFIKKQEKKSLRINKIIFNNNTFNTITHVLNTIYLTPKITLIGYSDEIPKLAIKINKELGVNCTYQENSAIFSLNEYKKSNTQ